MTTTWAVDVRYPGEPLHDWPTEDLLDDHAEIGSVTVCAPDHTTLHVYVRADSASTALELATRAADSIALHVGLQIAHAAAAVAV